MGACASLPKGRRDDASAAPLPEPLAKEESVQADQHNTDEVIKVEKEENKANEVDESKQESVGSLLDDQPEKTEGKKESTEDQQPQVEAPAEPMKEQPKKEETNEEAKPEPKKEEANEEAKVEAKKEEPKVEPKKEEPKPDQASGRSSRKRRQKQRKLSNKSKCNSENLFITSNIGRETFLLLIYSIWECDFVFVKLYLL